MKKLFFLAVILGMTAGCTTYQYAQQVKLVSFEDDIQKGKSVGPIRGEDCIWSFFGYKMGGSPTLDRAMANARSQASTGALDAFKTSTNAAKDGNTLRYINNVSTEHDGFNAVIVGKECLVVKGNGYK